MSASTAPCASRNVRSNAILSEDDLSEGQRHYLDLNAELAKLWPVLNERKPAPADADEWKDVKDKLKYLER